MDISKFTFPVLGVGHLAAAVRVRLRQCGLAPADCDIDQDRRQRVLLACSDYECASSFADANRRAIDERAPILFAWITRGRVEIGPLVVPLESPCFECQPTRIWDFGLSDIGWCFVSTAPRPTLNPDTRLRAIAHFGSLLLVRELCSIRRGAGHGRLIGRVVKFDPCGLYPRIAVLTRTPDCPVCGRQTTGIPASR
jgi:bacteriocin biosynthesis cyclodehydratase domain-containing protein